MGLTVTKATGLLMATVLVCCCNCQQTPPTIYNNTAGYITVYEHIEVGTILRTILASDDNGDEIIITFPEYNSDYNAITLNQTSKGPIASADIILKAPLDRDYNNPIRKLIFVLTDDGPYSLWTQVTVDMFLLDINDEVPVFTNVPYRLFLSEDTAVGTTVFTDILAIDPDSGRGGRVSYSMEANTQSTTDAATFMATFSINRNNGQITLVKPLDYEQLRFYQFHIIAKDGDGLNSTEEFIITLLDVQDTPPQFHGEPYVVSIPEDIPQGEHFFTVRALDGDRGDANDVTFAFSAGFCMSHFDINQRTGEITVVTPPDRDTGDVLLHDGMCEIGIQVDEVGVTPQLGVSRSSTVLTVFVEDVNDNPPTFNLPSYTAYIEDSAHLNFPLRFENDTKIVVTDIDQGANGVMELVVRSLDGSPSYDFEPDPNILASSGSPIIKLKNPEVVREARDQITVIIYAIERDTKERFSSTASVVINILAVTTTPLPTTTAPPTTTVDYKDSYIPSVVAVVFATLLIVWAGIATCYYCIKYKGHNNNKVGVADYHTANGKHPPPESPRRTSVVRLPPVASANA